MNSSQIFIQGNKENEWNKIEAWQKIIWEQYSNNYNLDDDWFFINIKNDKIYNVNGSKYKFIFEKNIFFLFDINKNIKRMIIEMPYHKGIY
tara:strand:+ start:23 stop:295 length:273 start_codon:yes stop_codon:yes gene_type:complete